MNAEQAGSKRSIVCCPCRFGVCWNPTKAVFNWEHVDLGCWWDWSWVVGLLELGCRALHQWRLGREFVIL